jgi:DNA-binding FadR family transcriptional regulator
VNRAKVDRDLEILSIIQNSVEPIGSWALVGLLEEKGLLYSTATIGRILHQLEQQGYLEKKGYQGRIITKKGENAIVLASKIKEMEGYKEKLDDILNSDRLHHFLMVLEARKTIERETTRLAALNITKKEIKALKAIESKRVAAHKQLWRHPSDDREFHHLIAKASRNQILIIFSQILSVLSQKTELFDYMRTKTDTPYYIGHRKVIAALEEKNPDKAEKGMIEHIDRLIEDVSKWGREHFSSKQ